MADSKIEPIYFSKPFFKSICCCENLDASNRLLCNFTRSLQNEVLSVSSNELSVCEVSDFDLKKVIYYFILNSLNDKTFLMINKNIRNEYLFEAFKWASFCESKQKKMPLVLADINEKKSHKPFSNLLKAFLKFLLSVDNEDFVRDLKREHLMNAEFDIFAAIVFELSHPKKTNS